MNLKLSFLLVLLLLLNGAFAIQMITDCIGLQNMQNNLTANYVLANDIDCSATVNWNAGAGFAPIGNFSSRFLGTLNGQEFEIFGLFINRTSTSPGGLFGVLGSQATVDSVSLVNSSLFVGSNPAGGLACYNYGMITNTYASGSVSGTGTNSYVGGLVSLNYGTIINACAFSSLSSLSSAAGGLVSINYGTITNSYATGAVAGFNDVGGLVGINNGGSITNAYATGSVFGGTLMGGLVGNNGGTVTNSYATSSVFGIGSSYIGGLVGANGGVTINAYWDTQTSQQFLSNGGLGLSTALMQLETSFLGWDFLYTWSINPARQYPFLQVFVGLPVLSTPLPNVTVNINNLLDFPIPANAFTDSDGLQLSYTAALLNKHPFPAWLVFDTSIQTFLGTPASGAQGFLDIEVTAYATASKRVKDVFRLTILNRTPLLNALFVPQMALNGQTFQFVVPDATFFDADGDRLQLSATTNPNGPLPTWLNFNAPLGIFSGTSTQRGTQSINVTANDGFGGQVSALLQITTPNTAPKTTGTFPNQVVVIAQLFSFTIPANLFSDLDGDLLTYSASLFGGGQLLSWLNFNAQTLTFQGTPDAIGFLVVSVIATDPYNATASLNFGVSVSALAGNSPPLLAIQMLDQTATAGQSFTLALPNNMFIEPNGSPLIYIAMLEGGAPLPSWLNFSATSLVFSGVSPTTGSLHITVRADNGGGGFALDTFTLTILSNQHLPPFLQNPISNQVASVGGNYQFTIPSNTFTDVNNAALTYTATTSGNGRLPGWLHFNANTRTFAGTPSNTDTNIYSARITTIEVRASNGIGSAVTTFQLSVTGTSQAAQIINVLITLASIASTAFALYRNRAFLWNTFFKRKYEKEPKQVVLNEPFTYQFNVPSEKILYVKAFDKAPPLFAHTKCNGCLKCIPFNRYQKLLDGSNLPTWLDFNRKTMTLSGTAKESTDLYICAEGFDGRYLEAFKLRCGEPPSKDVEMQNI